MDKNSETKDDHPEKVQPDAPAERFFESLLWSSRLLVMLAVVPSLIGATVLFCIGTADIIEVLIDTIVYYLSDDAPDIHDSVVPNIIIAVDIYLIAIVLLIFGSGVYRLFVSPIDQAEMHARNHPFNVHSFDQLKDKITRVVILAVIIEFFRAVVDIRFQTPLDAIYLALSVLALALALFLMNKAHGKHDEK